MKKLIWLFLLLPAIAAGQGVRVGPQQIAQANTTAVVGNTLLSVPTGMLLADHSRAIVGSINLTPGGFDRRRELAIEVFAANVVHRLARVAHHDWKHSHPLDLTDTGLLAELEEHHMDGSNELALCPQKTKEK